MLISVVAALALFAAPEATQSGAPLTVDAKPAAAAPPEMRKVCETIEVSGSNLPKKKCHTVPVKAAPKTGDDKEAATTPAPAKPGA